ncbi:hypothetical protein LJR255_000502 [Pararhizobium sp. LjRoot255]
MISKIYRRIGDWAFASRAVSVGARHTAGTSDYCAAIPAARTIEQYQLE